MACELDLKKTVQKMLRTEIKDLLTGNQTAGKLKSYSINTRTNFSFEYNTYLIPLEKRNKEIWHYRQVFPLLAK